MLILIGNDICTRCFSFRFAKKKEPEYAEIPEESNKPKSSLFKIKRKKPENEGKTLEITLKMI